MYGLHDEGPVERSAKGLEAGEPVGRRLIRCVARVPDNKEVIADAWYPMKSQVEVHPLVLIVVLHEAEEGRAGVEGIFEASSHQCSREASRRQRDSIWSCFR